jgi:4-alpha-glucanotransferase
MDRSSGILLAVSSLSSRYGIGSLGAEARRFVDFLEQAGQRLWQLLPIGPTSYGDSPYSSFSSFAGNPLLIDLETLCAAGLLTEEEAAAPNWGEDPRRVDYGRLYEHRFPLLETACRRGWERDREKVEAFAAEKRWIPDYALFMALKRHFGMTAWRSWDEEPRLRRPAAMKRYREELAEDIRLFTYIQYLFFRQWESLRAYAAGKGVLLVGDLPFYVAMDSADVWAEPEFFLLDGERRPAAVAGVTPDYFSRTGQLWGNPLYDWDAMKKDGYGFWIRRMEAMAAFFDAVRIDHFRGFESYCSIPSCDATALRGQWECGPGLEPVRVLKDWFFGLPFIAEDLGDIGPGVLALLSESGFPGMRVLQFAFDGAADNRHLPHNYEKNAVCYTGTHDNDTLSGWFYSASRAQRTFAREYFGLNRTEGAVRGLIRGVMGSVADWCVVPMQDWLGLGSESRMNVPGTAAGNWRWRLLPGEASETLAGEIRAMTRRYGRLPEEGGSIT